MNEIHDSHFEYHPQVHYLGKAAIHLMFHPSDKLQDSLNQFVNPDERHKYGALLKSDQVNSLRYTGGDSGGLQYLTYTGNEGGMSDREWLSNYQRTVAQISSQTIPVAAYRPRLERTKNGALMIELALLPGESLKRKIGSTILRTLHVYADGRTPDEVVYARTMIPESLLVDEQGIKDAQVNMMNCLGVNEDYYDTSIHESPKTEGMFVRVAHISDRPIS
ncbi:MAG TPA: hypothetical protein VGO98_00610 [Candidatus Saccharimonadales bacterium]|jgi:hypothetical protein|nr:hypothetical protein [Candidatus Saccharimonadales bacterium]